MRLAKKPGFDYTSPVGEVSTRIRGRSSGVEHNLAKVGVVGSNPIARSIFSRLSGTNRVHVQRPVNHVVLGAWILVGALIPVMSFFGRPIQRFISDRVEGGDLTLVMGGALVVAAGASLAWMARRRSKKVLWHGLWLVAVMLVITQLVPNATEWFHFILFGAFGLLATIVWRPAAAIVICLAVSVGDEYFQWLLPDRVGDLRDVAMNVAACLLGAAVALIGGEDA